LDTRTKLLNKIITWKNISDMVGTSKPTIAYHFASQGRLRASFFFSKRQGDRGHAKKFFTTIILQIAHVLPILKRHIREAVAKDYRIGTQYLSK
jgi:hypothetical protein